MPRSESPDGKQPINRNMKLHNVSYQRSLSQTMSAFSCIPFILLTIDMSSSLRIENLPSSYSSESAEWTVLHKKINKKNKNVHFLHLVNFTEFRPFCIRYRSVSRGEICQNCIVGIGLFNLSSSREFLKFPKSAKQKVFLRRKCELECQSQTNE